MNLQLLERVEAGMTTMDDADALRAWMVQHNRSSTSSFDRPHLSYSAISKYLSCGENFRRIYIEKEPTVSGIPLIFGSAFHNTLEAYIADRAEGRPTRTLAELWPEHWAAALEKDSDIEWGADTPEQHYNDGLRIISDPGVQELADGLNPLIDDDGIYMERKIELHVPGVPIPIIGYIDIMTDDGVPGDFKTSKYKWSAQRAKEELQSLFYLAALNQAGQDVPGLRFRHYVVTKSKKVQVQTLEHQHTYDEILWLFELVARVWQAIEINVFPLNPSTWLCSPRYCNFWSTCRGRGMRS